MADTDREFRSGFIAIVGRPNVGKSTLLNHLIGQKISITSRKAQTTRHRIHGIHTDEHTQFVFVDTPGFQTKHLNALNRGMNRVVTSSLRDVQVVMYVLEALRYDERDQEVLKLLPDNRPVLLVINKIDEVADKGQLFAFAERVAQDFKFADIVPVSAKLGSKLDELREAMRRHLPQGELIYDKDDITDRSERFLAAEILREKIFRYTGDELPYSTSVVIEQFKMEGKAAPHPCRDPGGPRSAQGDADRQKGREAQGDRHPGAAGYGKAVRRQGVPGSVRQVAQRLGG